MNQKMFLNTVYPNDPEETEETEKPGELKIIIHFKPYVALYHQVLPVGG